MLFIRTYYVSRQRITSQNYPEGFMQYLLMDAHQRFLGTFSSQATLIVGDTFQNQNNQTYAVVGMNWSGQKSTKTQALTVILVGAAAKKAELN